MEHNLYQRTAVYLREKFASGETDPQEVVASLRGRIAAVDGKVHAVLRLNEESLGSPDLKEKHKQGRLGGIPVLIKDNMCVEGEETTCASRILEGFRPPYDATVITKLKEEGAVLLGKANMDEFAFGSSTESSAYGPTYNPWNLARVPGGSSGGSAAAVAADETILALGSDTGGSIRQPAALCGVVGMKPTYGRVSRYGLIAFASSLDQIGPLTKDVSDAALLLSIIAGHDPNDSTSADIPVPDYTASLVSDVQGMKIGIPRNYFVEGMDSEVEKKVREAIKVLAGLGARVEEVSLPHTDYAVACYYIIGTAEASSNLARFDGVQYGFRKDNPSSLLAMYNETRGEGFGREAKRRINLGTYVLSSGYYDAYYLKAQKVRTLIKQDFDEVFAEYDCIVTPTSPTPAFRAGEKLEDPLSMYLSDILTIPANLAGIPGISIPCGFSASGLPIGLQILGKPFDEETIIRAAYTYENNTPWHRERAKL